MSVVFALGIIAFIGFALVYVALRLPDINPRKRFGKPTTVEPSKPVQSSAPRRRGRYMDIVGQPHTDLSIYFSASERQPDKNSFANRRQVEKMMGDKIGVSTSPPLDDRYESQTSSDNEIAYEELARYPSMSSSEQRDWKRRKLDGLYEKEQAVKEATSQLVGSPA